MTVIYFGPAWDAPALDNAEQVPTPVGETCPLCPDQITETDRGFLRGAVTTEGWSVRPTHALCEMLTTFGHSFGICGCSGFTPCERARNELLAAISTRSAGHKVSDRCGDRPPR